MNFIRSADDKSLATSPTKRREVNDLTREATVWFMRQQSPDFTEEEQAQLDAWRKQSPRHDLAFEEVCALWHSPNMHAAAKRMEATAEVREVLYTTKRRDRHLVLMVVAASLCLVGVGFWIEDVSTWLKADFFTVTGQQREVMLPDQSIATLNTNSAIAVQYSAHERHIHLLRGEASFAVQHDPDHPFVVETRDITITALGTEFLVRHGDDIQITVLSGSVEVAGGGSPNTREMRIAPGEQMTIGPGAAASVRKVDISVAADWMEGRLVFVRSPLNEVIQEFSRYYPGYIMIWDPTLHSLPVTGVYSLSDPSRVLTTLANTLPIKIVRLTDRMVLII